MGKKKVYSMQVGIRQFRNELAQWLERVREGNELVVTDRGEPIARVLPAGRPSALQRLIDEGLVTPPRRPKSPSSSFKPARASRSVSELIFEEHGHG